MNKIKNLFANTKRALISLACIVVALAVIGTGTIFAADAVAESKSIGKANAENLAFADAGIDQSSASALRTEFDREDGKYIFEVEFIADGIKYDYILDATNGVILDKVFLEKPIAIKPIETERPSSHPVNPSQTESVLISLDDAKQIALTDAEVAPTDVTYTKGELDYDDGILIYDIEFYTSVAEYEYEINAATGAVVYRDIDMFHTASPQPQPEPTIAPTQEPGQGNYIGIDRAKNIALTHAGFSVAEATFTRAELERDDGRYEYEIEFYVGTMEYDYTIDAITGAILEFDWDEETITPTQEPGQGNYIGVDRAKSIALAHAGFSEAQVTFIKAKLENDDGRYEYEIEFYVGSMEYEYTIDAITGAILEYESEYDD